MRPSMAHDMAIAAPERAEDGSGASLGIVAVWAARGAVLEKLLLVRLVEAHV